jgi:hypothetical protein
LLYKTKRRLLVKTKGILSFFVLFTLAVIMAMPGQGEAFDDKFAGTYFAASETGICYLHVTSSYFPSSADYCRVDLSRIIIGPFQNLFLRNGDEISFSSRRIDLGQICSISNHKS